MKTNIIKTALITWVILGTISKAKAQKESILFKTPLSFYNADLLSYLQVQHRNGRDEELSRFLYPIPENAKESKARLARLSAANFGYQLKYTGIKETEPGKWQVYYHRKIGGTREQFSISCTLYRDTTRLILSPLTWKTVFER